MEATGLLPGVFVAKALQLPIVFARKSRQIGISDSYQTSYKSVTSSKQTDLYVSTEYLTPGDRVIIIDDFLAGGTTADALVRVCKMAGATVVGGGFLIEKLNDAGRAFMSGYQIPLESLAIVEIEGDRVKMVEESKRDDDDEDATQQFLDRVGERQRADDALDAAAGWSEDGLNFLGTAAEGRGRAVTSVSEAVPVNEPIVVRAPREETMAVPAALAPTRPEAAPRSPTFARARLFQTSSADRAQIPRRRQVSQISESLGISPFQIAITLLLIFALVLLTVAFLLVAIAAFNTNGGFTAVIQSGIISLSGAASRLVQKPKVQQLQSLSPDELRRFIKQGVQGDTNKLVPE